jgi:hypothetical protein
MASATQRVASDDLLSGSFVVLLTARMSPLWKHDLSPVTVNQWKIL